MTAEPTLPELQAPSREEEQAEVIRRLEEDIIFGRFAPGLRLVEDTLMQRYGASRHFVRQALFQLERQGIVLREKNVGATVRFYSAEEVRQIYEVREMLTRQAALMIALPAPQSLIDQLSELQRHYSTKAEAQDMRGIHETNDAFHLALFSACGNPYLVRSLQDYHEPDAADARQKSRRQRGPRIVAPPARIDDRALEGPRRLGAGAALRRSHAVQQGGLSRPHLQRQKAAIARYAASS
ncbi:DNA-binding GntR family transcriptional regulator [Bradyrhizobium japonicum]